MSVTDTQLPAGWAWTTIEQIATVIMGQSPPSSTYNEAGQGLPFFQGKAEFGDLYPEIRKWCTSPNKIAERDDVLLSIRAPVGPTNLAPAKCCIGRGLAAVRPAKGVSPKFVLHALRTFANRLSSQGTGTTFKAVSGKQVRTFRLPIAPESEQSRIVEKIEELFSDLDAGVAALERVQAGLKRYRASVLKAAVEGRLTEEWRAEHPDVAPASDLLERILAERRRRWEQDQLARYEAKGKKPPKNWKAKYNEPVPLDTTNLPDLPPTWCWASIDQVLAFGNYGTSVKCTPEALGIPVLRIPNIDGGEIDLTDLKYSTKPLGELDHRLLQRGDILVCRTNGSISLVGKGAVVRAGFDAPHYFASYLIRLRLVQPKLAGHVHHVMESPFGRGVIETNAASSAGQHNISLTFLRGFPVPLPPQREIEVMEDSIAEVFSTQEAMEEILHKSSGRSARLRQAILKRAFEGRLVPQDPDDEPADALLARIRDERESGGNAPQKRKRRQTRRKKSGKRR